MPLTGPTLIRKYSGVFLIALLGLLSMLAAVCARGQERNAERELVARSGRFLPDVGPGLRSVKRDGAGRYYVLASPANTVFVFGADGKRAGQIPYANSKDTKIVYAVDLDVDPDGRIFVADRGANTVKIFAPDGSLISSVRVAAPTSLACLSGGDFAVSVLRSERLLTILNENGSTIRSFGDAADASITTGSAPLMDRGRVFGDSAGRLYFAFAALSNPTFRIYDRFGFASADVSLPATQFVSSLERKRVDVFGIPRREKTAQSPFFNAIAVDPDDQDIWGAVGNTLLRFAKDGTPIASYPTYTAEGAAVEPVAILVEAKRILLGSDPLGVFDFARPDKPADSAAATK